MAWVETWFPWWTYEEDEDEDWSILDKKAQEEKLESRRRLTMLQGFALRGPLEVGVAPSKVTYTYQGEKTTSVLK